MSSSRTPTRSTSRLRVLEDDGRQPSRIHKVRSIEQELIDEVQNLSLADMARFALLSANGKTSISLDVAVTKTCKNKTNLCELVCYALRNALIWRKSLRKRLRNWRYIHEAPTEEVVEKLEREFRSAQRRWARRGVTLDFLRICGTGDLFAELVSVINAFALRNPDVRVWVVTRIPDLAAEIGEYDNVYVMLSLDATTPPQLRRASEELVNRHARAYLSFLRTAPDQDTCSAAITFNEKRTSGLPYHASTDCPADAGIIGLNNDRGFGGTACSRCRKCFSPRTLVRQRRLLEKNIRPIGVATPNQPSSITTVTDSEVCS